MNAARLALLTTFGLGRLPAPGTWGSAFTVAAGLGLVLGGQSRATVNGAMIALLVVFGGACVVLGPFAERHFGRKDPGAVVADETAGQAVALLALPWSPDRPWWNVALALVAFACFRILDIAKPPPIRQVQRLPAGWGILVDDLIAGGVAWAVVQGVAWGVG